MPRYPGLSSAPRGLSSRVYTSLLHLAQEHAPEVFPLSVGDTYRLPAASARTEALSSERMPQLYNYAAVQGEPRLLEAISADLTARGRPVPPSRIQVTSGATSGLDIACRALLSPGDEVIVLAPFWPLIRGIITAMGAVAVELPFFTELRKPGFDIRAALNAVITERTVAVYVNNPHNPTGTVLRADEMDALADVINAHNLWLLADEAYERLYFGAQAPQALWCHERLRERSVVAHTLSKTYGLAGARVGFVHGPQDAMEAVIDMQTYATYCTSKPMQLLAASALQSSEGNEWVESTRALYAEAAALAAHTLELPQPEAGTFVIFDTRRFLREGETTAELLVRVAKAGVVLTPGIATGSAYADWARLCFTTVPPDKLARGLSVLKRTLFG